MAIDGDVYDVTGFLDVHPGGRQALIKHAGRDASAAFWRHHSPGVLSAAKAPPKVAKLSGGSGRRASVGQQLDSPFPHSRFEGTGLLAVRFQWANLDALTATPDQDGIKSGAAFRQKNQLAPLSEADWLHVHPTETYVREMSMRHMLLMDHDDEVTTHGSKSGAKRSDEDVIAAEREVLDMVLDWLSQHEPARFKVIAGGLEVQTLTPGYQHAFKISDFERCPMKLAALLVQEDLVLMREEDIAEGGIRPFGRSSLELQREDHPTGKRHVLVSGISCFSTNVAKRFMLPMSGIHHPAVPGFQNHLQHAMNRFMAQITPEGHWRHNYMFQDFDNVLILDHPWAKHVCQEDLKLRSHHKSADRSARFSVAEDDGFFRGVRRPRDVRDGMRLRCEYQTLRRLKRHGNFIVFTIKNYVDRMYHLESQPSAALALSAAMRLKPKGVFYYQSMGLEEAQRAVLGYLDGIVAGAGLRPWRGVVPEPWQRDAEDDGTFAAGAEAAARAALETRRRKEARRVALLTLASLGVASAAVWLSRFRKGRTLTA